MRILILTSRLPYPPHRGDRLRVFNFIKSLHRQHEIYLVSFISNTEEVKYQALLEQYCKQVILLQKRPIQSLLTTCLNFWKDEPLQSLYYRSKEMRTLIESTVTSNDIDVIYVHLFRMAQFVNQMNNYYRILDLTDVISREVSRSLPYRNLLWRLLYYLEYPRIKKYEEKLANLFEEIWLISSADLAELASQCPEANIHVITNGVDINKFFPAKIEPIPYRIIFTGHMGVHHNIDAARFFTLKIFPEIRKSFPGSTFVIAGAEPAPSILELSNQPNVNVLGYVENLNRELNASQLFVAPLRFAAGIQNKVLEAMAAGIPVLATNIVNEGLNARAGEEILIANSAEEFIQQTSILFNDNPLREKIRLSGLKYVRRNFSWDIVLKRMNSIEMQLLEMKSTAPYLITDSGAFNED